MGWYRFFFKDKVKCKLRIDKAKEMLRGDTPSLTDIAITVGYANISDFSKALIRSSIDTP